MSRSRWAFVTLALLALPALLASACGRASAPAEAGDEAAPDTVELRLEDNGATVRVDEGDVVKLDLNESGPERRWILVRYPKDVLFLESSRRRASLYEFDVRAAGRGRLFALDLSGPGLMRACERTMAFEAASCPAGKGLQTLDARPVRGPGIFSVAIVAG